jgi:prepilin-type N-terminal cleavage/methylation domain-containing protein
MKQSAWGFTLVEIMIVVAVVAIVFAIGAPSFVQVVQKEPMRQAVSDIVELLGQARAQSILRGVAVEFRIAGEGVLGVVLVDDSRRGARLDSFNKPLEGEPEGAPHTLFSARLHDDVAVTLLEVNFRSQMEADEARVRFHPNGTCDDFTVVLEFGREMRRIWVDPITALADVETLR